MAVEIKNHRYRPTKARFMGGAQVFRKIVEVPTDAQNVRFYQDSEKLPERYRQALQAVR